MTNDSLEGVLRVYGLLGFVQCDSTDAESHVVKIAIYIDPEGTPTHVARQTRRGTWKSKLGKRGKDIEHDTLELLSGDEQDEYGEVAAIMKKRRYEWEDKEEDIRGPE